MGITGVGKSTFISKCTSDKVEVGHGLKSHTNEIQVYSLKYVDKTVHLIDTPGFDDTYRSDIDVLKDVSYWLNKSYKEKNIELTGIVYLHRITDTRMGGTARKDLQMFKKLCGENSFSSVVLATTMWSEVSDHDGNRRELELRTSKEFYGSMVSKGSTMFRHTGDRNSAMNIIAHLINKRSTTLLNIQREMANEGLALDETEAGRELDSEMIRQREHFNKMMNENQAKLEEALQRKDEERAKELAEQQEVLREKIDAAQKSRDELRVDMEKLFHEKDEQFKKAMEELDTERKERERVLEEKSKDLEAFKKAIREAEELFDKKRKMQEEEMENVKMQLEQANSETIIVLQSAILAMKEQEEENNQKMKENLARAAAEKEQREHELIAAQTQAAAIMAQQSTYPQFYNSSPFVPATARSTPIPAPIPEYVSEPS
ncbi:hypothetical protein ACLOAV_001784 [Pseudogymnoascus australis]